MRAHGNIWVNSELRKVASTIYWNIHLSNWTRLRIHHILFVILIITISSITSLVTYIEYQGGPLYQHEEIADTGLCAGFCVWLVSHCNLYIARSNHDTLHTIPFWVLKFGSCCGLPRREIKLGDFYRTSLWEGSRGTLLLIEEVGGRLSVGGPVRQ